MFGFNYYNTRLYPMSLSKSLLVLISILIIATDTAVILTSSSPCTALDSNGICLKCDNSYMLDDTGNCMLVSKPCSQVPNNTLNCSLCQNNYIPYEDKCIYKGYLYIYDAFCHSFQNKICKICSFGYYFNSLRRCQAADYTCKSFNKTNGQCVDCYRGHILMNGTCLTQTNFTGIDSYCKLYGNLSENNMSKCIQCEQNYYLNSLGYCQPQPLNCAIFNFQLNLCSNCNSGYAFNILNKQCEKIIENKTIINQYCYQYSNGTCMTCSSGFAFDTSNNCIIPSNQCRQSSQNGTCLSCYQGWTLINLSCVVNVKYVFNPLCLSFQNGVCSVCSYRSYMNQYGICVSINQLCNDFNPINGNCISCYLGYKLTNFNCLVETSSQPQTASLCAIYDSITDVCQLCIPLTYLSKAKNKCNEVSGQCRTFNNLTGFCTSCYPGYILNVTDGDCIISNNGNFTNCQQFQYNQCLTCLWGFQFDMFHNCIIGGAASSAQNGSVLSLNNQNTINFKSVLPDYCVKYENYTCVLCQTNYQLVGFECLFVSHYCETKFYNSLIKRLTCTKCYQGYLLQNNDCISNYASDPLCQTFSDSVCIKCAYRTIFNDNGKCQAVSDLCLTWNQKGQCISCYWGYKLESGNCIVNIN